MFKSKRDLWASLNQECKSLIMRDIREHMIIYLYNSISNEYIPAT